ncbi:hypothetical protein BDZ97DRAFT_1929477 [Flammula alnicola]|nr:hypothetical protein BDZ97DRAFT_1929477 [Flammula alnicola]
MSELKPIIFASFHYFVSICVFIKCFLSFSQKKPSRRESLDVNAIAVEIEPTNALASTADTPATRASSSDDVGYTLHFAQSFDKAGLKSCTTLPDRNSFARFTYMERKSLSQPNFQICEDDIFFGAPSTTGDRLNVRVSNFSEDDNRGSDESYGGSHESPLAAGHNLSPSGDVIDFEQATVLDDSVIFDILSSLHSDSDSASYDADTSDEFLRGSLCDSSLDCSLPDWIQAADSNWKNEVATAMDAFRTCRADDEGILSLLPKSNKTNSESRRMSHGKQLREIQEWRNDFGPESEITSESPPDADCEVASFFQFP